MSYRDLFIEIYQEDGVECLQFDDENFGCGDPLPYKMQVVIGSDGATLLTSTFDQDTGEERWVPDPTRYRSLEHAAQAIIARYLQHYKKNANESMTDAMGLTTMQEWMQEFAGKPVVVE